MSYSKTAICNVALGHLGINRLIADADADASPQAQACRTHYALALEVTLKAHRWPFAQRVATLATISGYTSDVWTYAYRGPTDLLLAHTINRTSSRPQGERFERGGDASGAVLYSDAEDAILDYTAAVTSTGLYPADFVEALAYQIAIRTAQPLASEEGLRQAARKGFTDAITQAMASAGNESMGQEPSDGEFLAAREVAKD
jgi:hypothetical protein